MGKESFLDKVLSALAHTVPKAPANLTHYPVIVVGSNVGGVFTNVFSHYDHGHTPVLASYGK